MLEFSCILPLLTVQKMIQLKKLFYNYLLFLLLIITSTTTTNNANNGSVCQQLQHGEIGIAVLGAFNTTHLMMITTDGHFYHLPMERLDLDRKQLLLNDSQPRSMWAEHQYLPPFSFHPRRHHESGIPQRLLLMSGHGYTFLLVFTWNGSDTYQAELGPWQNTYAHWYDLRNGFKWYRCDILCDWVPERGIREDDNRCGRPESMLPLAWATGPTDTSGPLPRKEYRGIDYHTVVVSGGRACFFAFYFGAPERTGPKFELGVNYFLDPIKYSGKGSNETYNCWPKEALPKVKKGGLRPPPPDTGMVWLQSYQMLLVWNEGQYRWKESGRVSLAHLPNAGGGGSEKAASSSVKWKSLPPGWELSLNRQNSQMKVNWTVSIDSFIVCPKEEEKQVDNEDNGGKGGGGGGGNGVSPGGGSTFFSKFLIFSVLVVVLVFAILFFGYRLLQERSPAVAAAAGGGNKKFKIKRKGEGLKSVKKEKSPKQAQASMWSNFFSKVQGTNLSKTTEKLSKKPTLRPSTLPTSSTTTLTTSLIPTKIPFTIGPLSSLVNFPSRQKINRSKVNHPERQRRRLKRTEQQTSALHRQVRSRLSRLRTVVTELVAKSRMALRKKG